jgi:hypothetical protein
LAGFQVIIIGRFWVITEVVRTRMPEEQRFLHSGGSACHSVSQRLESARTVHPDDRFVFDYQDAS